MIPIENIVAKRAKMGWSHPNNDSSYDRDLVGKELLELENLILMSFLDFTDWLYDMGIETANPEIEENFFHRISKGSDVTHLSIISGYNFSSIFDLELYQKCPSTQLNPLLDKIYQKIASRTPHDEMDLIDNQ